MTYSWYSSIK